MLCTFLSPPALDFAQLGGHPFYGHSARLSQGNWVCLEPACFAARSAQPLYVPQVVLQIRRDILSRSAFRCRGYKLKPFVLFKTNHPTLTQTFSAKHNLNSPTMTASGIITLVENASEARSSASGWGKVSTTATVPVTSNAGAFSRGTTEQSTVKPITNKDPLSVRLRSFLERSAQSTNVNGIEMTRS